MKRTIFTDCLKRNKNMLLLFLVFSVVNALIFWLYHILFEPFLYAEILAFSLCLLLLFIDYLREKKHLEKLQNARDLLKPEMLPAPRVGSEETYTDMVQSLHEKARNLTGAILREKQDMQDYYTVWVHQIKTPIAVMKLKLKPEDTELSAELFRIEQYVVMALTYIRLESSQNDLVIREYSLDDLIQEVIRKYAPQFISKKLKLDFCPTGQTILTDKKWFLCLLEQLISNAIKYTEAGSITLTADKHSLTISDTGIGIAAEDLPRIFEKGFTGMNGRTGAKSSGLGLYLCKKAADLLSIPISVSSEPGKGSSFTLQFPKRP